jgi:hypothetical protein
LLIIDIKMNNRCCTDVSYTHIIDIYVDGVNVKQVHTNTEKFLESATVEQISGFESARLDGSGVRLVRASKEELIV